MPMSRATTRRSDGFTLIELMLVVAVSAILAGATVASVHGALAVSRADAAMAQVASVLRLGRDYAIAQRRPIEVRVTDPNRIELVRLELPTGTTTVADVHLEHGARFLLVAGLPDTPDAFGQAAPIDFGGAASLRFLPDGTLTDAAALPINGTIFTAMAGEPLSARAVTVAGGSARAQPYRWTGSRWEAR